MGLFGSLFTGVSSLFGQSQNTAIISNNIANIGTVGFKRSEASFQSLVTTESRSSVYSPGTITVNRLQRVDQQGALQQTASGTDASISGNGFFPIKRAANSTQEFLYTRAGQFSEDAQGLLRNAANFVLYAWPIDADGNLPANQGDLSSLVAADVAFLGGLTRPTSTAELAINLNASESESTLAGAVTGAADFTRGLTVYDSLGSAQTLTFQYTKTYGPHASAVSGTAGRTATTDFITDLGSSDGDTFTLVVDGGAPRTYEIDNNSVVGGGNIAITTIGDLINDINGNVAGASAFLDVDGKLVIQRDAFVLGTETITLDDVTGTPLGDVNITAAPTIYTSSNLNSTTYDNGAPGDTPSYSGEEFPAFSNLPGASSYNNRGWWQIEIIHPDGSVLNRGLINFNSNGTINAQPDSDGNIDIELSQIDWGNGSSPQNINVDIERFSAFAGNYDVIYSDQNGAELGLRTGVEITREGIVVARFSNGASADLYKIPLITFANANGLNEQSGTAYAESEGSGEENLREAGLGGAGFVEPSTLEASNVDLADEFAKLIISQRAFGASTRLINTVDQMTEDLLRLR